MTKEQRNYRAILRLLRREYLRPAEITLVLLLLLIIIVFVKYVIPWIAGYPGPRWP